MPVFIGICAAAKVPVSPLLMGLAVAANTGGTITMVGTPPNIIASGALEAAGIVPFTLFEFAYVGIPLSIMSIIYMVFIGRKLVPKNMADLGSVEVTDGMSGTPRARIYCLVILIYVILGICFGIPGLTAEMVAISGALLCVLLGCLTERQAYKLAKHCSC